MLDREWLSTFAPVGVIPEPGRWQPIGAGVFIARQDLVWLTTAKHVVQDGGNSLGVLVPINGQPTVLGLTEIMANAEGVSWIADPNHDIAVAPIPIPPGIGIKAIKENQCLRVGNIIPSMSCLTGGCPYGLPGVDRRRPTPIVLDGVIAGTDAASRTVFISTPTFQGNSGGPIIAIRTPHNPAGNIIMAGQAVFLAGIVSRVRTIRPQRHNTAPLRLGVGVAVDVVFDLLDGHEAASMARQIKASS